MNSITAQIQLTAFIENHYSKAITEDLDNISSIDWNRWFQNWINFLQPQIFNNTYKRHEYPKQLRSRQPMLQTPSPKADDAFTSRIRRTRSYELSLRLTSDREMATFNRQYRHQDRATDVLAFAALETDMPQITDFDEPLYLGDIIISLDTALRQAQSHNHSLTKELAWLSSHGLLHLLGWDHPDEASLTEMLDRQSDLLSLVGL
ncbi:rRNA maturation RNase YbeY [Myxosarcina sp. GI1]|uniref:rRNA maturation RNase YbeY n=1 Tax=Myxosarcina sp. GI1 TaxID=1541065 RepID=UPI000691607E|nr:rRNA maturation RNase YbeY [Myxosarcina sp. GI1]